MTPGTTADPKIALIEIHRLGPAKIIDTPGIDERGPLGAKKKEKAFSCLKDSNVLLVVVDPFEKQSIVSAKEIIDYAKLNFILSPPTSSSSSSSPSSSSLSSSVSTSSVSSSLSSRSSSHSKAHDTGNKPKKTLLIIYNLFADKFTNWRNEEKQNGRSDRLNELIEKIETSELGLQCFPFSSCFVDLSQQSVSGKRIASFIEQHVRPVASSLSLFPPSLMNTIKQLSLSSCCSFSTSSSLSSASLSSVVPSPIVFLNIPLDDESPSSRLLRPQSMCQEALLREFVSTFAYRMNLTKGRSPILHKRQHEERRFRSTLHMLLNGDADDGRGPLHMDDNINNSTVALPRSRLSLLITDSQAMDLVHPWTLGHCPPSTILHPHHPSSSSSSLSSPSSCAAMHELVPITTFSILMANFMSGGRLEKFVEGIRVFEQSKAGDRVLICEACNHNRIQDDIGTVLIPKKIDAFFKGAVKYEHAFGREYQTKNLSDYKLIIHCGGCMLDMQQMSARLNDFEQSGVAITNYGLLLSFLQSKYALQRVLRPWGIHFQV
eukprot:TRINITY_DN677_c4_g1_i2.p1 TRINITY_DN677_c4_g1~~TRINITY_DN677_c4_g1_i2.p1  ORF type:complete len:547 (+),score=161.06 TRINITY_DN677_c4_g1_i2:233-1873(+)